MSSAFTRVTVVPGQATSARSRGLWPSRWSRVTLPPPAEVPARPRDRGHRDRIGLGVDSARRPAAVAVRMERPAQVGGLPEHVLGVRGGPGSTPAAPRSGRLPAEGGVSPVGLGAGGRHHLVEQVRPDLVDEPVQVAHVPVVDDPAQLHLDRDHLVVGPFDDEVDLLSTAVGTKVADAGLSGLCTSWTVRAPGPHRRSRPPARSRTTRWLP